MKLRLAQRGSLTVASSRESCRRCSGLVERIPRLGLDRLLSLFVRVRRYRCCSRSCQWQGLVRAPARGEAARSEPDDNWRPYL